MEEPILRDFFIVRRDLYRMYESGQISFTELVVFEWLCYIADMYGYAHVRSYAWFAGMLPNQISVKPNTIGKIFRSLRSHGFVSYEDRQGSRKGFKIKIGFWPIGNGKFRVLDDSDSNTQTSGKTSESDTESQVNEELAEKNHMLSQLKNSTKTALNSGLKKFEITGHDIDREIKNENKTIDISTAVNEETCIAVSGFNPQLGEHARLKYFAELCGDRCMNYWLGKYKQHGQKSLDAMSRAEVRYKEANLKEVKNKPAFFTSLIEEEL